MGSYKVHYSVILLYFFLGNFFLPQCIAIGVDANQTAWLFVNASEASARPIPETLFGIFFEEINHAGAGGLWAELVSNRGFEAGGPNVPSNIDPWSIIGDESSIIVSTDRSSCFERNKIALRMEVLCDSEGTNICPAGGVGIYNPGFWGMNIEKGKTYKVVLYVRSLEAINLSVSLTGSNGLQTLATSDIIASASDVSNWTKVEVLLEAKATDHNSRLQLKTSRKGVIWFDQVSAMPLDTYKGHGFRNDLSAMMADLKPRFVRFPGGCFVEGEWLRNAFRWKATIGPWEERPGHFGDVWMYWTDDGLGYFEFLQLSEDLGAFPVWVFNNGISHNDQVDTSSVLPFVQEALDGIEFARGDPQSKWGSVRAAMGHPEPFDLRYVAIGNEDCGKKNYRGNYLKFYNAIRQAYPDIKMISNCDGSSRQLDHPADFYDYHVYTSASNLFSMSHQFDRTSRNGPKAFVSEYAVTGKDAGTGSLLAGLAEAAFLIGIEKNSDVVEMASYAPLFVNTNDRRWNPDAIVFNSSQLYGTPSYCWEDKEYLLVYEYMQKGSLENHLFRKGSPEPLPWNTRLKIAIGAARGLSFLHTSEKSVIYRDFKPANILLDGDYNAKLSDFGLAKLGPINGNSHVTTRVMGTYGYAAPEYVETGHLYVKSDVYGFGVVLLEMITGLRAHDPNRTSDSQNLVLYAKPSLSNKKKLKKIMDSGLGELYPLEGACQAAQLILRCLESDPKNRPSMENVLEELENINAIVMTTKETKASAKQGSNVRQEDKTKHQHRYNHRRSPTPQKNGFSGAGARAYHH